MRSSVLRFCTTSLLLAVGITGCATLSPGSPPRIIVTPEQAAAWQEADPLVSGYMPEGPYWLPIPSQIRALDQKLARALTAPEVRSYPGNLHRLGAYGIQYLGIVRDSRRLVHANGFCDWGPPMPGPDEEWVWVFDGGGCFFGATYDPETGELLGPGFNGLAWAPHNLPLHRTKGATALPPATASAYVASFNSRAALRR